MAVEEDNVGEAQDTTTTPEHVQDMVEFDRDELADKIGDQFDEVFGEDDDEKVVEEVTEVDETDDETQEAETEETDEVGETDQQDQQELVDSETDGPTLPDAYRRSLRAYGWDDSDIDSNLEALGLEKFMPMAERIHDSRNKQLAEWAELGRAETEQDEPVTKTADTQSANAGSKTLTAIDPNELVRKLGSEYGEDEAIVQVIKDITGPVNATIAALNSVIPDLEAGRQAVQQSQEQVLLKQVNDFFGSESMKPYQELYGNDWDTATPEQTEARWKVVEFADRLSVGAAKQGRNLTVEDALADANNITAADFKGKVAVKSIKKEAKKRNRAIVQRPGGKASKVDNSKSPTDEKSRRVWAEKRAGQRLAEIFGS